MAALHHEKRNPNLFAARTTHVEEKHKVLQGGVFMLPFIMLPYAAIMWWISVLVWLYE